jgi:hypothetical protein
MQAQMSIVCIQLVKKTYKNDENIPIQSRPRTFSYFYTDTGWAFTVDGLPKKLAWNSYRLFLSVARNPSANDYVLSDSGQET